MGKPTEHLAMNEKWHTKVCSLNKFFFLTTILWAKKNEVKLSKHNKYC